MSIDSPSLILPCPASPQERTTPLPPLRTRPESDCVQEAAGEAPSGSDSLRPAHQPCGKSPLTSPLSLFSLSC